MFLFVLFSSCSSHSCTRPRVGDLMFNNGTGHHVHGGVFYNVDGDVNLQTHQHLTIQDSEPHETAFQLLMDSTLGLDDGLTERSRQHPGIEDPASHAASFLSSSGPGLAHYGRAIGSEAKGVGVARNSRRAVGARQSPYGEPKIPLDIIPAFHSF